MFAETVHNMFIIQGKLLRSFIKSVDFEKFKYLPVSEREAIIRLADEFRIMSQQIYILYSINGRQGIDTEMCEKYLNKDLEESRRYRSVIEEFINRLSLINTISDYEVPEYMDKPETDYIEPRMNYALYLVNKYPEMPVEKISKEAKFSEEYIEWMKEFTKI